MPVLIVQPEGVTIPAWVVDLTSFRRWADSSEFPNRGRITYLGGTIVVDLSMEQLFVHNQIKMRIAAVLDAFVTGLAAGYVFGDGVRLHNTAADLSAEPDVVFVSADAIQSGRVRLNEGLEHGFVSIEGTPDAVIEVVSDSSVQKDTVDLREAYAGAGIPEYWLVDARSGTAEFDLLKRGPRGYTVTRAQAGGWLKSAVFNRSFRITRTTDPLGNPQFTLEHRA